MTVKFQSIPQIPAGIDPAGLFDALKENVEILTGQRPKATAGVYTQEQVNALLASYYTQTQVNALIRGPAFSAYQSTVQALPAASFTKLNLQSEEFDTATCFDSTTNYRFTPNVAGYYQITAEVMVPATTRALSAIYKNGSLFKLGTDNVLASATAIRTAVAALVQMNGTTDYVELFVFTNTASTTTTINATDAYFQGFLARPL